MTGAVAVLNPLLSSEIIKGLNAGQFIFIERGNKVVVEQDINTFVSFTADKGEAFRKNRTLRVMDAIAEDVRSTFENYYLGKCANDEDGRELFREELFAYLTQLYELRAVEKPETFRHHRQPRGYRRQRRRRDGRTAGGRDGEAVHDRDGHVSDVRLRRVMK